MIDATVRTELLSPLASQICAGHYRQTDSDRLLRPHGLPDWGLVYTLAGRARFAHPDGRSEPLVTRPGLIVLTPANQPSLLEVPDGLFDHLWLHFLPRPHWQEWLEWPEHPTGRRSLFLPVGPIRRAVVAEFHRIQRLTASAAPDRELFALNALETLLLWCQRAKPEAASPTSDVPTRQCIDYICEHLAEPITLARLARHSGQSVSRLTQQFRRQTGLSPMEYLAQRRFERAMQLLERTRFPIKQIAAAVGFANPFYFTLRFHRHTGFSPRAFRLRTAQPAGILRRPDIALNPDDHP